MRKFLVTGAPLLFVMHSVSLAQPTSPTFEVASVKPAVKVLPGANGSGATGFAASSDAALVRYSGVSFKWLLTKAFQTSEFAISGPSWIDTEKYDVVAKLPDGAKKSDIPAMLQQLLAERFHLVVRQHEKVQRDYAMVVGKSGLLLKPIATPGSSSPTDRLSFGSAGMAITNMTLGRLAEVVGQLLKFPVIDTTQTGGQYSGVLPVSPSDIAMLMSAGGDSSPADPNGQPTNVLVDALKTVGLELVKHMSPIQVVEVVSADRVPTSN